MFWGNDELKRRLDDLIEPYEPKLLDRATYRLTIGAEIYVSPTGVGSDTKLKTKKLLSPGEHFQIPAGQFALLITEEIVYVPEDALAFISIRARYKFQGLVNVSGFHVDPGFRGRLIFSVFNAGPSSVHLFRGEDCFHIWFADLRDQIPMGDKIGYKDIPPDLVKHIADGIQSLSGLEIKINETDKRISDQLVAVEKQQAIIWWLGTLLLGIGITLTVSQFTKSPPSATPSVTVVTSPTAPAASVDPAAPAAPAATPTAPTVAQPATPGGQPPAP
ncbi:deoxycytidine triphosphate deaminase [Mesorhizobium sp. B2-5-13]|uniref:dCTP deaminase domain-containing protein n=1 Tax=unclassified Mesorhizobium TaxID=325217 RepID=UPI0011284377|nr:MULTISPECIES: deoxycytidine triphosphate deaminase [unclassified Mesorhizobium]TPJ38868.1 deoxycytidine triphosphate deaminase [Mesorhizobium sp. B2-6-5]TPJ79453.1 deoxycytidine triphosphate deaminase [Mesorhizobium sp. B2-5-13]TPK46271.1 deoxycytidine triphosphate deaminase [Mesorhizobium sp. B2-5-5]